MDGDISGIIAATLKRAPAWIRHDLLSSDPQKRMVAEETLAARIAIALGKDKSLRKKD